jgi:hypothetical protein
MTSPERGAASLQSRRCHVEVHSHNERSPTELPVPADSRAELRLIRAARPGVLVATGIVYSWWLSSTTPFTSAADAGVAAGFAVMAVAAGITLLRRRSGVNRPIAAFGSPANTTAVARERPAIRAWVVALSYVLVVELLSYFAGLSGNRHDFPTISSLYDTAAESQAAKAAVVFAWMALGWGLFHPEPDDVERAEARTP